MSAALRSIGQLWVRAVPAGTLVASALILGQLANGYDQPAPTELVTEAPADLTPDK